MSKTAITDHPRILDVDATSAQPDPRTGITVMTGPWCTDSDFQRLDYCVHGECGKWYGQGHGYSVN